MNDPWLALALGLLAGIALGALLTSIRHRADQRRTSELLANMRSLVDESMAKMPEQFQHISAKALQDANVELRAQGEQVQKSQFELYTERQAALDALVRPIQETLDKMRDSQTQLGTRVDDLRSVARGLQDETGKLVSALRRPEVRGRWGELQLKRVVELAGMQEYVDYLEQPSESGGARRPDMIVHLPNKRQIVVDAKTPLDAYLNAYEAEDESARQEHLRSHAEQVKQNFQRLAEKRYWDSLENRPDFVVMFIPGEVFYSAALQEMPELIELSAQRDVLIATPTILIALLRAVHLGWREQQLAERARYIGELGNVLYERARVLINHIGDIGTGIGRAVVAYNKAVGSLEQNYLPQVRRFRDLGTTQQPKIQPLEPRDIQVRALSQQKDFPLLKADDDNEVVDY